MTDQELEKFEAELRQIKPVKLPDELVARLQASDLPAPARPQKTISQSTTTLGFRQILRLLIPATAVICIVAVIWRGNQASNKKTTPNASPQVAATTKSPLLKADNIEIGKELVSSFDAVAMLPGGEPVRFRCQQWMDQVVVNDKSQGLLVENRTPRVVVVPVGFETY
ncbi:MAG: hypothetical protein U1F83_03790 [Verrucomicrobiota bacterium]